MKPSVGRIVHFFERDKMHPQQKIVPRAAIITQTFVDLEVPDDVRLKIISKTGRSAKELETAVMLTLFLPGVVQAIVEPVFQGTERGCWNWPEREPAVNVNIAKLAENIHVHEVPDKWPGGE